MMKRAFKCFPPNRAGLALLAPGRLRVGSTPRGRAARLTYRPSASRPPPPRECMQATLRQGGGSDEPVDEWRCTLQECGEAGRHKREQPEHAEDELEAAPREEARAEDRAEECRRSERGEHERVDRRAVGAKRAERLCGGGGRSRAEIAPRRKRERRAARPRRNMRRDPTCAGNMAKLPPMQKSISTVAARKVVRCFASVV